MIKYGGGLPVSNSLVVPFFEENRNHKNNFLRILVYFDYHKINLCFGFNILVSETIIRLDHVCTVLLNLFKTEGNL